MNPDTPNTGADARGAPESPFWDWTDAGMFVGLALPSLALALLLSWGVKKLAPGGGLALSALSFQFSWYLFWFAALYLMLKMKYDEPFWPAMGWKTQWPGMWITLFAGPALAVAVIVLGTALHTPEINNPIQKLLVGRWPTLLVGLFATTFGPFAEELGFRGFLLPLMTRSFGMAGGIAVCSLTFVALHGPQYSWSWQHLVLLLLASVVFCLVRIWTGSTAASTLVHATYNLTFFTGFLLQERDRIF
jgi:membrane protease YdiL (CAAX protease family)